MRAPAPTNPARAPKPTAVLAGPLWPPFRSSCLVSSAIYQLRVWLNWDKSVMTMLAGLAVAARTHRASMFLCVKVEAWKQKVGQRSLSRGRDSGPDCQEVALL